jgi:hypothetical protein
MLTAAKRGKVSIRSEVLDRRKPRKETPPFLQPGRLANLLGPAFDPFLAQQIELSHHSESDNCEVMIKRVGEP